MDYDVNLTQQCPVEIQQVVRDANLNDPHTGLLFDEILEGNTADFACFLTAIGYIGEKLTRNSNAQTLDGWLGQVATYAGYFQPQQLQDIRDTMIRLALPDDNGLIYFAALRRNGIDIRTELAGRVPPVWTFSGPRDLSAMAWHYNMYLARFRDAQALDALSQKIASTQSGNDATLLLTSLAEVGTVEAREVIRTYSNDTRTADGVDGPGLMIKETVELLLLHTVWQ